MACSLGIGFTVVSKRTIGEGVDTTRSLLMMVTDVISMVEVVMLLIGSNMAMSDVEDAVLTSGTAEAVGTLAEDAPEVIIPAIKEDRRPEQV